MFTYRILFLVCSPPPHHLHHRIGVWNRFGRLSNRFPGHLQEHPQTIDGKLFRERRRENRVGQRPQEGKN